MEKIKQAPNTYAVPCHCPKSGIPLLFRYKDAVKQNDPAGVAAKRTMARRDYAMGYRSTATIPRTSLLYGGVQMSMLETMCRLLPAFELQD